MLKMNKITPSNSELHSPEDLENTKIVDNLAVLWITTVIRINGKIDSELHSPQNRLYFGIALTQISELNSLVFGIELTEKHHQILCGKRRMPFAKSNIKVN